MVTEVKLPELGPGIASGDVLEVFLKEGDMVTKGQDILEIETDKASMPVPSNVTGKVVKVLVKPQQSVPVGSVLIEVEVSVASSGNGSKPTSPQAEVKQDAPKKEAPKQEAPKPQPSAPVAANEAPTKLTLPVREKPADPIHASTETSSPQVAARTIEATADMIPAGPAIRRLAREMGVELADLAGTGVDGRITRDDILEFVRQTNQTVRSTPSVKTSASGPKPPERPTPSMEALGASRQDDYGPTRVDRMSKVRKTIASQMLRSWSTVPRVTNFDDADITDLERLRNGSKEDYAAQGLKLTTMPFLIKAVATALRHHPSINATIDTEKEEIIYRDYVNIGIAVDTDRGLVVPVMRDVDRMGISDIARGVAELSAKVRGGQFTVQELRGGTFTISNLGAIGGTYSTPIVNVPEVAILLIGRSRKLPVVMPDDSIKPRLMMPMSLSYDHRLVDGGSAARFLNDVIGYLEAPTRLLMAL